ncbi:MipA/OmpV family protein [Pseudomonas maumuensis]|uniref:MipA/OmpV family protein n=1 Tax=Pseudomonas maumuensis TaxID=2842354 RepID=A0ABX8NRC9_9PSED|nr:MipA/OmpV family protein [Pseudomonas maumuensis]QXH58635.1 MipA/OmpV family protein [Pseudomonas maumuensis]
MFKTTSLRNVLGASFALNLAVASTEASAQEQSALDTLWGDETQVSAGFALHTAPRYMGAKGRQGHLLPSVSIQRGIFFADSLGGVGVQHQFDNGFSASLALGYDFGRADGDSKYRNGGDQLKGMGEVGGATVVDINLAQQVLPWLALTAEAELRTGGYKRGNRYQFGLLSTLHHSNADTVTLGFNAHAGQAKYNQTYFGVTGQQSDNTAFDPYKADKGIYAYSSELSWMHRFDPHWSTIASVNVMHYTDQVRESPIVRQDTPVTSTVGVQYSF